MCSAFKPTSSHHVRRTAELRTGTGRMPPSAGHKIADCMGKPNGSNGVANSKTAVLYSTAPGTRKLGDFTRHKSQSVCGSSTIPNPERTYGNLQTG